MIEVDNTSIVLYHYLRALSVKVSRSTVHRLLDTPLGDSIRGISDALDILHVKNEVYKLPSSDYFSHLESPFITMLQVDINPFCVVTKKGEFIVEFINGDGRKHSMKLNKFLLRWTGIVLFGEPTEKTSNEHYYIMKNIISYFNALQIYHRYTFYPHIGDANSILSKSVTCFCCIFMYIELWNTCLYCYPLQRMG